MHVYLDESGDTGFKFRKGSSQYFVIGLLIVDNLEPLRQAIDELSVVLKRAPRQEFKFAQTHDDHRVAFFEALRPHRYRIRCLIVDKQRIALSSMRSDQAFYDELVRLLLTTDPDALLNAHLVIDESFKGRQRQMQFSARMRRELNSGGHERTRIRDVSYRPSHRDTLLQAADMIVGAIARRYERGDSRFYQLVRKNIEYEWKLPELRNDLPG